MPGLAAQFVADLSKLFFGDANGLHEIMYRSKYHVCTNWFGVGEEVAELTGLACLDATILVEATQRK